MPILAQKPPLESNYLSCTSNEELERLQLNSWQGKELAIVEDWKIRNNQNLSRLNLKINEEDRVCARLKCSTSWIHWRPTGISIPNNSIVWLENPVGIALSQEKKVVFASGIDNENKSYGPSPEGKEWPGVYANKFSLLLANSSCWLKNQSIFHGCSISYDEKNTYWQLDEGSELEIVFNSNNSELFSGTFELTVHWQSQKSFAEQELRRRKGLPDHWSKDNYGRTIRPF